MIRYVPRRGEKIVSLSKVDTALIGNGGRRQHHVVLIIRQGTFRKRYGFVLASSMFDGLIVKTNVGSSAEAAREVASQTIEIRDSLALYYGRGANPSRRRAVRPPSTTGRRPGIQFRGGYAAGRTDEGLNPPPSSVTKKAQTGEDRGIRDL